MNFIDMKGNPINVDVIERDEQNLVRQYIKKDDIVLELGARYGSVSCAINFKLNNKNNQVSVEPDNRVWKSLKRNKEYNKCNFNIVEGFISNKKLSLINKNDWIDGYAATSIEDINSNIPSYTLDEIKNKYNLKFNVLVADCEGFLETFFDENPDFYNELRMIIFEADYDTKCNYNKIKQNLESKGFQKILSGFQNVYIKT